MAAGWVLEGGLAGVRLAHGRHRAQDMGQDVGHHVGMDPQRRADLDGAVEGVAVHVNEDLIVEQPPGRETRARGAVWLTWAQTHELLLGIRLQRRFPRGGDPPHTWGTHR